MGVEQGAGLTARQPDRMSRSPRTSSGRVGEATRFALPLEWFDGAVLFWGRPGGVEGRLIGGVINRVVLNQHSHDGLVGSAPIGSVPVSNLE
ncbi:hypothetical protein [Streptomyces sp. CBMA123]|uniref:hypothetical protein n=1 Tax=Streptomyces sp. CBMA123 TaxID=1896313 RepID=UPI001661B160|nr:hypothetical protein [Streptomyces sp. CBMA123]MBD0691201.1 hypothetical protein [Streptomyces sp. CBMA123]